MKQIIAIFSIGVSSVAQAGTFTVLHAFGNGPGGTRPEASVVIDGNTIYGTTIFNNASIYKVNKDGTGFGVVFTTNTTDWSQPNGLLLDGQTLYGTTYSGSSYGTIFKVNKDGSSYAVLKTFTGTDGSYPLGRLILVGEALYGTTASGGTNGFGTVFKMNTNATGFTVLHSFLPWSTNNTEGVVPMAGLACDGTTLFGTTSYAGAAGYGTVFKLDTNGNGFTVLHSFSLGNSDGGYSQSPLVLSGDTLYGTAAGGGPAGYGVVFKLDTNGNNFAVLHSFDAVPLGEVANLGPWAGLALNDDTLYGAAENDANWACGTVFKLSTNGSDYAVLHYFSTNSDLNNINEEGGLPLASPVISGKVLFGAAAARGPSGGGSVFSLQLTEPTAPVIFGVTQTNGVFTFNWSAVPGNSYQVQYSAAAGSANWSDVGPIVLATNGNLSFAEALTAPQRFYRVVQLP